MNKKESIEQKKKFRFSLIEWLKSNFSYLIIIFLLIYLLTNLRSQNNSKSFTLQHDEKTDKIIIHGLEDNVDLDSKEVKYAYRWTGQYEYSILEKNKNWWNLFQPVIYHTISEVKPDTVRRVLEKENGGIIVDKKKKSGPLKLVIDKEQSNLLARKKGIIQEIIEKILILFLILLLLDFFFGTRFISGIFSFISYQRQDKKEVASPPNTSFKDIGGLSGPKEELQEMVDFFHNPDLFLKRGARAPKGVLLVGPPGNGKTLLAKALAGECKLPFIYRSAPELEKGIVGWGAMAIRDMFSSARQLAKQKKGCIVFVDEIDAITGSRIQSANSHHETLNQLLVELDGFNSYDNIMFLAATNSLDRIDPALLRPGRFDRHILVPLPSYKDRLEIINICLKKKHFKEKDIDLEELVAMTEGLSGAQIVNIFNESAILSIRYKRDFIDKEIIFEAFDRTLMGPPMTSYNASYEKKLLIAYHEAGHAVIGMSLPETIVKKITIISRWTAGGYTWVTLKNQKDDGHLINKSEIIAQVTSLLGGRASEEIVYGDEFVTVGAYSDFKKVSSLIRNLVLRDGMSDLKIVATQNSPFFGEENLNELSELKKQKIDKEIEKIQTKCWEKAKIILKEKRKSLDLLAHYLVKKNTLQKEEIYYIFINEKLPNSHLPLLR